MSSLLQDVRDNDYPTSWEDQIHSVCRHLRNNIFDFVIAGGYVRDKAHGVEPKDCDICIYNFHASDPAEAMFLSQLILKLEAMTGLVEFHNGYQDDVRSKDIDLVIKLPELKIDIIFYSSCKTAREVVSKFDCNLNQYYNIPSIPVYDAEAPQTPMHLGCWHHLDGKEPTNLIFTDKTTSRVRREKMIAKWNKLCKTRPEREPHCPLPPKLEYPEDIPF